MRRGRECFNETNFRIALSAEGGPTNGINLLGVEGWARPPVAAAARGITRSLVRCFRPQSVLVVAVEGVNVEELIGT